MCHRYLLVAIQMFMPHPPTFDLSKLLINDMLKIEKNSHPFDLPEVNNMMKNAKEVAFKEKMN